MTKQNPLLSKVALKVQLFRMIHPLGARFQCPVCNYSGPFRSVTPPTGKRINAKCPSCSALERHRLQHLVMAQVFRQIDVASMRMLHFAPEPFFSRFFRDTFGRYETADIAMPGVDHRVDLQALPFDTGSYDIVYASHVLEHVPDDSKAIAEIRRILAPGGLAILPVPIVNPVTAEYAFESMHVRAPGPDYFRRLAPHFSRIDTYTSTQFPEVNQTYLHVDRTMYPTAMSPLRLPIPGTRHADFVPVCWA